MALVTYHGPRPEITASFPMRKGDIITFTNGRPNERKQPGPHSYVLPKDHPVPVGVIFAMGLAVLVRQRGGLWLTVRLGPGDWDFACHNIYGLRRVTPRMLATPRRRRHVGGLLRRRAGTEYVIVSWVAVPWWAWWWRRLRGRPIRTYRRTVHRLPNSSRVWAREAMSGLAWEPDRLRASARYALRVNEEPTWRAR